MKKTLGTIAAGIGVVTATVALVKECTPDQGMPSAPVYQQPAYQEPVYQQPVQQPVPQPAYSSTCCTNAGNCMMMDGAQLVGAQCFCFNAFGQMAPGTVCQ
jgi:hypothetical protein